MGGYDGALIEFGLTYSRSQPDSRVLKFLYHQNQCKATVITFACGAPLQHQTWTVWRLPEATLHMPANVVSHLLALKNPYRVRPIRYIYIYLFD